MSTEVAIEWDEDSPKYTLTMGTKVLTSLKAACTVYYQIMLSSRRNRYAKRKKATEAKGDTIPEDVEMTATEEVLFNFAKVATEALQPSEKA